MKKKRKKREGKHFWWVFDWREGRKKKLMGPGCFLPGPTNMFSPQIREKTEEKTYIPTKDQIYRSLFSVSMHWVMLTLCCFFFFFSTSCLFIQSFKRLVLHFLAFPFSFSNQRWCYQMGAIIFFSSKKAPLIVKIK